MGGDEEDAGSATCSCKYLDEALETEAAHVPQRLYESFCLQQAEQQL